MRARSFLNKIVHFLDIPMFTVVVYCGTVRPDNWPHVLVAIGIGVSIAIFLALFVPRLARSGA